VLAGFNGHHAAHAADTARSESGFIVETFSSAFASLAFRGEVFKFDFHSAHCTSAR
jgi:hypothetical protein